MNKLNGYVGILFLVATALTMGCQPQGAGNQTDSGTPSTADTESHGHSHDGDDQAGEHAHAAPHGGHLVELGRDHNFHAEFIDDHDSGRVTVYVLDGDMKPVDSADVKVALVVTAGDATRNFALQRSEDGGPGEFETGDSALIEMLDHESVEMKFRVSIEGKPYLGNYSHHHHEDDHDHSHGDDHDHEH